MIFWVFLVFIIGMCEYVGFYNEVVNEYKLVIYVSEGVIKEYC